MRCFVAIELSEDVRRELGNLQRQLGKAAGGVRWVGPDAMHLTLKFLGEAPDAQIPALCESLKQVAEQVEPFDFDVRSTGCFPPHGGVRVVWVGLDEPSGRLASCQRLCEDAFAQLGFAREDRPFVPHLTLGRVKDPHQAGGLRPLVASHGGFDGGLVSAEELVLFESRLNAQGATYVAVARARLGISATP